MPEIEPGWLQVDLPALAADAGLSLIGVRKLLRAKWIAGEIDMMTQETGHGRAYYVRPPSAPREKTLAARATQQPRGKRRPNHRLGEIVTRDCFVLESDFAHYQWCVEQLCRGGLAKPAPMVAAAMIADSISAA